MHPFLAGYLATSIVLGAVGGAVVGVFGRLEAAALGAAVMTGGSLVGAAIAAIGRGYDAPSGKLWLAATLGNPLFLLSLLFTGGGWNCFAGGVYDLGCFSHLVAGVFALACCLPPCVGLLLRRRRLGI
jgi:hypothetical protein